MSKQEPYLSFLTAGPYHENFYSMTGSSRKLLLCPTISIICTLSLSFLQTNKKEYMATHWKQRNLEEEIFSHRKADMISHPRLYLIYRWRRRKSNRLQFKL